MVSLRQRNAESTLRLALLGILPERLAGEERVADFLLFHLNRRRLFDYVDVLGLPEPTNDVHEVRPLFRFMQVYSR